MKLSNFKLRQDKGIAGTDVLLGLIVALFIVGLLVMIFALMGSKLQTASFDKTTVTVLNETVTFPSNNAVQTLASSTKRDAVCNALTYIANNTRTGASLSLGNITKSGCTVTNATTFASAGWGGNGTVSVSYTYTWSADNTATNVIGNTTSSLSTTTDFFSLFIVIGAMVVLILLTVIIIVAIRQSGLLEGGTA